MRDVTETFSDAEMMRNDALDAEGVEARQMLVGIGLGRLGRCEKIDTAGAPGSGIFGPDLPQPGSPAMSLARSIIASAMS